MDLALAEMRSLTLQNIEAAIRRLEQGTFGICTDCGVDIAEARLRALPFARLCQPCQAGREREERRQRHADTLHGWL
jgi:DnaK suppressor protein